ncbi:hypothetical protein EV702DRAFT_1245234 [Suillus placidus]|uniref:DUF6532 domain-containing protein n=1 Tax=Suillus placidus TaxID=48579 RepID=A0A9P7A3P9_9AGAM|nr:hypothetical protein EV702DRAFT_1245234 [Suillus placidus]
MSSGRGSQRKSKAKVPKPLRGSGLNPSGESATNQLNIPTEQPQMSFFSFDAHVPGIWQDDDDRDAPMSSAGNTSLHSLWSYGGMQGGSQGAFDNYSQGSPSTASTSAMLIQPTLIQPALIQLALIQRGQVPQTDVMQGPSTTASMSVSDTMLIQQGEIPQTDVMHIATSSTSHQDPTHIRLSNDTIDEAVKAAMKLVMHELFDKDAMTTDKVAKKAMLTKVIHDAVPRCLAPNVTFEDFITSKHRRTVANALSVTRGRFVEFAREGIFNAYRLFPPLHSTTPPITYRKRVIEKITTDADGLVLMHIYTFDQDRRVEINARFQNPFIMSNVIHFIWFGLRQDFLGETEEEQLQNLKYMWALAGAAMFCSLDEQSENKVQVDRFQSIWS